MQEEIKPTIEALKNGKLILYPSGSWWAIGCDVRNEAAVQRLGQLKQREPGKPFTVGIAQVEQLHDYVQRIPEIAWDIVEFSEKPLTVIYSGGKGVAPSLLAPDGSIAIQLVRDEFCRQLIRRFGRGIVLTAASRQAAPKPRSLAEVDPEIVKGVDYPVNLPGPSVVPVKPATIIRLEVNGQIQFIRK
jgi:L-threonylcarbamoyladenylate synthase